MEASLRKLKNLLILKIRKLAFSEECETLMRNSMKCAKTFLSENCQGFFK